MDTSGPPPNLGSAVKSPDAHFAAQVARRDQIRIIRMKNDTPTRARVANQRLHVFARRCVQNVNAVVTG